MAFNCGMLWANPSPVAGRASFQTGASHPQTHPAARGNEGHAIRELRRWLQKRVVLTASLQEALAVFLLCLEGVFSF